MTSCVSQMQIPTGTEVVWLAEDIAKTLCSLWVLVSQRCRVGFGRDPPSNEERTEFPSEVKTERSFHPFQIKSTMPVYDRRSIPSTVSRTDLDGDLKSWLSTGKT